MLTVQAIREVAERHQPLDPVLLDMIPEESRKICASGQSFIQFLLDRIESRDRDLVDARNTHRNLREAIELYAKSSNDTLFFQNLELCLQQVRQQQEKPTEK